MVGGRRRDADRLMRMQGGLVTARQLESAGIGRSWVRSAVAAGELVRLRQGVYASGSVWLAADPARREALRLMAHQLIDGQLVGWGLSAAAAMGLPIPDQGMVRPAHDLVRPDGRLVRPDGGLVRQTLGRQTLGRQTLGPQTLVRQTLGREPADVAASDLAGFADHLSAQSSGLARPHLRPRRPGEQVIRLRGGPVLTLPVLTVVDCARLLPLEWGLALADAAISASWVKCAELSPAAQSMPKAEFTGPRGARRARWVLDRARAGSESVLESLARAVVILGGFPEPVPQCWISTPRGEFRVDLLDRENNVIIEADGKIKYDSRDVIWQEKRRQDALRDVGFEVVRFAMSDYFHPTLWWATCAQAHARGRQSRR